MGNSPDIARKHYLQTHEEHFQRAVEKSGLNRGLNTAVLPCTESQDENSSIDFTPCFATGCDDMREDTIQDKMYPSPRVGLEPTT